MKRERIGESSPPPITSLRRLHDFISSYGRIRLPELVDDDAALRR